jgi:ribosomal protein L37E
MNLLRRFLRHDEPQETKCPRCGVPAPAATVECTACGWDLRDAYKEHAESESAQH